MPRGLFARPVSGGRRLRPAGQARPVSGGRRLHPAGQARPVLPGCPDASHPQGLPWGPGLQPSVWSASYLQPTPFLSRHRTVSRRTAPSRGHNPFPLRPVVRGRTPPSRGIDTPHASHLQGTARLPGCFASAGLYLAAQTLRFRTTPHGTATCRTAPHAWSASCIPSSQSSGAWLRLVEG